MDDLGVPRGGGFDWEGADQGRIDLVLAELVGRETAALPPEEFARVLLGEVPARGVSMDTATGAARDLP